MTGLAQALSETGAETHRRNAVKTAHRFTWPKVVSRNLFPLFGIVGSMVGSNLRSGFGYAGSLPQVQLI